MPSATIIGAGPAGCAAALLLTRAGWDITLVEQHAFPRHKVCGECLSHVGHEVLGRLGLQLAFHQAGAIRLARTRLHSCDGATAELLMPDPMWALTRHALDTLLLGAAKEGGATLFQPYRCERIDPSSLRPRAEIRNLVTNRVSWLEPDYLLLADGRRALHDRPPLTTDLGIKAHFEGVDSPRDAIELFSLRGHYLGLAPVEFGRWNVAYSVPAARLRVCHGDMDVLFGELVLENPALARAFSHAGRITDWLASPLPRFGVAEELPAGLIPIGNAAASIEPIGGEGMGLALRSAELAAHALVCAGLDQSHPAIKRLPSVYRKLWRTRRPACRAGALVLSRPRLSSAAIDLLNTIPAVAAPSMYLVGK